MRCRTWARTSDRLALRHSLATGFEIRRRRKGARGWDTCGNAHPVAPRRLTDGHIWAPVLSLRTALCGAKLPWRECPQWVASGRPPQRNACAEAADRLQRVESA